MKLKYIEHADGRIQKAPRRTRTDEPARMQRTKGPGSMDCEQDIMALAKAGDLKAALALYDRHRAVRGVRPSVRLKMWAHFALAS